MPLLTFCDSSVVVVYFLICQRWCGNPRKLNQRMNECHPRVDTHLVGRKDSELGLSTFRIQPKGAFGKGSQQNLPTRLAACLAQTLREKS